MKKVTTYLKKIEKIGKMIPASKLKYTWVFDLNEDNFVVNIYHSRLSHKFEVRINGKLYMRDRKKKSYKFKYEVRLKDHEIKIMQKLKANNFQLFIDKKEFEYFNSIDTTKMIQDDKTLKAKPSITYINKENNTYPIFKDYNTLMYMNKNNNNTNYEKKVCQANNYTCLDNKKICFDNKINDPQIGVPYDEKMNGNCPNIYDLNNSDRFFTNSIKWLKITNE